MEKQEIERKQFSVDNWKYCACAVQSLYIQLLILIRSFAHCRLACVLGQEVDCALQYCIHGQICASGILCVGQEILEVCKKLLGLPKTNNISVLSCMTFGSRNDTEEFHCLSSTFSRRFCSTTLCFSFRSGTSPAVVRAS